MAPPQTLTFTSPDKTIIAVADADKWVTTVYRAQKDGGRKKLWSMYGWSWVIGVPDDGEHLVMANWLTLSLTAGRFKKEEPMLYFIRRGEVTSTLTLDKLIDDVTKAPRSVSHLRWGAYEGMNSAGLFAVKTFERTMLFDPKTGKRASAH